MNNIELHLYLRLERRQKSKRDARVNTSQREQYRGTVHLFIGVGRSLCKITFMPFIFTIDLRIIQRGLDSFFPLSRFLFLLLSRSFLARSFGVGFNLRPDHAFHIVCSFIPSPKVPVHILHLGNIVNHAFEELRKTKAPNNILLSLTSL
jgi:hypothetical protein